MKTTYKKIKMNDYRVPSSIVISDEARALIKATLDGDPKRRPTLAEMRTHPFFTKSFIPASLPTTALTIVSQSVHATMPHSPYYIKEPLFDEPKAAVPATAPSAFARREPLKAMNSPTPAASSKLTVRVTFRMYYKITIF